MMYEGSELFKPVADKLDLRLDQVYLKLILNFPYIMSTCLLLKKAKFFDRRDHGDWIWSVVQKLLATECQEYHSETCGGHSGRICHWVLLLRLSAMACVLSGHCLLSGSRSLP